MILLMNQRLKLYLSADLRFLRGVEQPAPAEGAHRHPVLHHELSLEPVRDRAVPIVAAEPGVASGGDDLTPDPAIAEP